MRYSLVSRTRATILGALIGEALALQSNQQQNFASSYWQTMAIAGAESLIELGRFDIDDWQQRYSQTGIVLENSTHASLQVILATLPVGLFFHEHTVKLRQNLLQVVKMWQDNPVVQDWALAFGYALAQSLNEKLAPTTLIPQIIAFLGETPTQVPQTLLKLNNLLEKQTGLEIAQTELNSEQKLSNALAMAFYCFASTLEDFRLSMMRATKVNSYSHLTSAITGALSGAYNSTAGIPVSWRFLLTKTKAAQWQLSDFSQMVKLADALVATWSGVYYSCLQAEEFREEWAITLSKTSLEAIAAPRIIRLR